MKAIRLYAPGGPDVLRYEDVPRPSAKAGEAVVKIEATGVNFIDILFRIGHFKTAMPFVLGYEAAGVVDEVGSGVGDVSPGERVAYTSILGSYAEYAAVPASRLVPLPSGLSTDAAAAGLFQELPPTSSPMTHTR